jgi:hypothetical protein
MRRVDRWQLGDMLGDRFHDDLAQLADLRLDAGEERAVGLRAAAHRLFERLAEVRMESAAASGQCIERRDPFAEIVHADKASIVFEPLPARIVGLPPGERHIGPERVGFCRLEPGRDEL